MYARLFRKRAGLVIPVLLLDVQVGEKLLLLLWGAKCEVLWVSTLVECGRVRRLSIARPTFR